jgi:hypothetical protein
MFRHGIDVKNSILFLAFAVLLVAACDRRGAARATAPGQPTTQTISPAPAKPAPSGTDAITQTVDIEDSRSIEEGGAAAVTPKKTKAPASAAKKKGRK